MFDNVICRELDALEGEDFKDYAGLPAGEFQELSDVAKLCQKPLVSVHMITYNHEAWIREAVESVVSQVCDFEYELLIMEDCSTDSTRQICFELQAKYPEKIRVLYGSQNARGRRNDARFFAKARGKWVAYLEGDDYWTDPRKLQKQIDLLNKTGAKGCFALVKKQLEDGVICESEWNFREWTSDRLLSRRDVFKHYCHTSTYVFEREALLKVRREKECPVWYDLVLSNIFAMYAPIALLAERVSVRRRTGKGVATSLSAIGLAFLSIREYRSLYKYGDKKLRGYILTRLANECCKALALSKADGKGEGSLTVKDRARLRTIALVSLFKKYFLLAPLKYAARIRYCRDKFAK